MTTHEGLSPEQYEEVDFEIAAAAQSETLTPHMNSGGWPEHAIDGAPREALEEMAERVRLYQLAAKLFLDDPHTRLAALGMVRLRGDWSRDDDMQRELGQLLRTAPYMATIFDRNHPDNKLELAVRQDIVSMQGVTMLTRRRRLMLSERVEEEVTRRNGQRLMATFAIGVTKVSTFALQIDRLGELQTSAAQEVRVALLAGMVMGVNVARLRTELPAPEGPDYQRWLHDHPEYEITPLVSEDHQKARRDLAVLARVNQVAQEHGLSPADVIARVQQPLPRRLTQPDTVRQIEAAIRDREAVLLPVTTAYIGERSLQELRPA